MEQGGIIPGEEVFNMETNEIHGGNKIAVRLKIYHVIRKWVKIPPSPYDPISKMETIYEEHVVVIIKNSIFKE